MTQRFESRLPLRKLLPQGSEKGRGVCPRPFAALAAVAFAALVAAALVTSATSLAGSATTAGGLIQTLEVEHSSDRPGAPTFFTVTMTLSRADGSKAAAVKQVDLHVLKHWGWSWTQFPKCDPARLGTHGPRACPQASRVGTGSAKADFRPLRADPLNAAVTAFNGKRVGGKRTFLLYFKPEVGSYSYVVIGKETSKEFIEFPLPRIPIVMTHFTLRTGAKITKTKRIGGTRRKVAVHYFHNPASCNGGWPWRFDFAYDNGEKLELTDSAPCTK